MVVQAMIFRHNGAEVTIDLHEGMPRIRYQSDAGSYWWKYMSLRETIETADFLVRTAEKWPKTGLKGDTKKTLFCSFCGKSQHEVAKLIAGPEVYICSECTKLVMDIVHEHETKAPPIE